MRVFIACCFALLLAGCLTQEERDARMQAQIEAADAADANRCSSYGAQPDTPAYTQCRMQLTQMRQDAAMAAQARQAAIVGQAIQGSQAIAAQQQQNMRAVVQPLPPQVTPTNCTPSYIGNQAYTHCQ
jgi:predicted esterase YcpF (UPF0227 family)